MTEPDRTHRVRDVLNSWRFWVVIAYGILFVVLVLGGVTYGRESSDRAARRAAANASYQQCLASIPIFRKINRFIDGTRNVGAVLLLNSEQMHQITTPGTLVYKSQARNIRRLRRALRDQRAVLQFPVPTPAECLAEYHPSNPGPAPSS
jgi:hypothetical protein